MKPANGIKIMQEAAESYLLASSNFIAIVEFFSYWTDAYIRVPKRDSITAWFITKTFNKMYFIFKTEFNTTKTFISAKIHELDTLLNIFYNSTIRLEQL